MSDDTIREMRRRSQVGRQPRRSFMKGAEVLSIRVDTLRVTQRQLAEQLIDPATGEPVTGYLVSKWEREERAVPLWAARHMLALAEAAREHDLKEARGA